MNENTITVMAVPAVEEEDTELDLLDLLADLLLKWKAVLALLLVGAILGCGIAFLKNGGEKPVTEEALADARAQIASDKATTVEQLFFQYVSYKELQEEMRAYYKTFAASSVNLDNTIMMKTGYYIISTIQDLDTVLIKMAMTEEDYQALRDILPDEKAGAVIYDRVRFTTAKSTSNVTIHTPGQEDEKNTYLIYVELYGQSEEQCREMMKIVEEAFQNASEKIKILDPEIKMEVLGERFDYNTTQYVQNLRKNNIDKMTVSEKELTDLATKTGKLSSEEKNYYNLMQKQYDEAFAAGKHVSWKKWTVIGGFLGAVIAAGVVFLCYVLDGKIQSSGELEQSSKLLNRVFIKGNKNLFGKWAAKLIHADETDPTVKADMVATDIGILMKKNGKNALMLLCNQEDSDAASFAEQVKARLVAKNGSLKICIGNPMCSVEELEMAAQADTGVIFAEMKKSKRAMLREWRQICGRYKLPLAGSVAVRRCW